jgi:hypothetical protein
MAPSCHNEPDILRGERAPVVLEGDVRVQLVQVHIDTHANFPINTDVLGILDQLPDPAPRGRRRRLHAGAVLGNKVLLLIQQHAGRVQFCAPDAALTEARENLPSILAARGIEASPALALRDPVGRILQPVEAATYSYFEDIARARLKQRDVDDWPVLAAALTLGCPIWTEDTGFFGYGVATWTTDRIGLYLGALAESRPV